MESIIILTFAGCALRFTWIVSIVNGRNASSILVSPPVESIILKVRMGRRGGEGGEGVWGISPHATPQTNPHPFSTGSPSILDRGLPLYRPGVEKARRSVQHAKFRQVKVRTVKKGRGGGVEEGEGVEREEERSDGS